MEQSAQSDRYVHTFHPGPLVARVSKVLMEHERIYIFLGVAEFGRQSKLKSAILTRRKTRRLALCLRNPFELELMG
jgi:hypothetical protein